VIGDAARGLPVAARRKRRGHMNVSDALRAIIASKGVTQATVAEKLGVSQPAVASVLSVGNPQTRVLCSMLNSLDYRLVAVPKDAELPEGSYELEAKAHSSA
jgi:transcriptional regulator with XRE-family HTH domain